MSILDTFYILFESNAKAVKKATDEVYKPVDDLDRKLRDTDDSAEKVGNSFTEMVHSAAQALGVAISVGAAVRGVINAEGYALDLHRVADSLDTNITTLGAWAGAVKSAGGSAQGFISDVKNLSNNLSQLQTSGGSQFAPMITPQDITLMSNGVELMDKQTGKAKDVYGILLGISDVMTNRMTKAQAFNFGARLGLSEGSVMLLQKGTAGVKQLVAEQEKLGAITQQDGIVAAEMDKKLNDLTTSLTKIGLTVGGIVIPPLQWLLDNLISLTQVLSAIPKWLKDNADNFLALGLSLVTVAGIVVALTVDLGALFTMMNLQGALALGLMTLRMLKFAAAGLAAAAPYLALAALLGLVFFVIRDIIRAIEGKSSITGGLFKMLGEGADWIIDKFQSLDKWIQKVVAAFEAFSGSGSLKERIARAKMIFEDQTPGAPDSDKALRAAKDAIGLSNSTPINSQTSNSVTNAGSALANTVSIGKVDVNTLATDADGIAATFGDSLEDVIRRTVTSYSKGQLA